MSQEIENLMAVIKSYARQKSLSFLEFVDYCIYPETISEWHAEGLSTTAMKRKVDEKYEAYNELHKLVFSSLA